MGWNCSPKYPDEAIAIIIFGRTLIVFERSGHLHPIRIVANLIVLVGMWSTYFGIVRDLRAANGHNDNLSIRVETGVGLCCVLGYTLAIAAGD